jgi:CRP-like cAMP-binding protein
VATAVDGLRRVPLFSGLSDRQLKRFAGDCKERHFRPGTTVVRQGKMSGISFFVVVDGEAAVTVDGKEVGRLRQGDHFGELALVSNRERSATVTAVTDLRCLATAFWDFRRFAKKNPEVTWKLLEYVVALLQDPDQRARDSLSAG